MKATKKTYLIEILLGVAVVAVVLTLHRGWVAQDFTLTYAGGSACTQEEVEAAAEKVQSDFKRNYTGCTLESLSYGGDFEDAGAYGGEKGIILNGCFTAGSRGWGFIDPYEECDGWGWFVVQKDNGKWAVATAGLG